MRGLRASQWAKKSCSLYLASQITVLGGMALSAVAAEDTMGIAEQVKQEREEQLAAIEQLYAEGEALMAQGKFKEADAVYQQVLTRLEKLPGELALRRYAEVDSAHQKLKRQWAESLLKDAGDEYMNGNYREAQARASEAALVDSGVKDKAEKLQEQCKEAEKTRQFRNATSSPEAIMPNYDETQQQIDLLYRQAQTYYDAMAYDDAGRTLEKIFLIDPYNQKAIDLLRKTYDKVYHAGTARRQADVEKMFGYMNWNGVTPVFPTKTRETVELETTERAPTGSSVMERMEKIIFPRIEFDKQDIFSVINFLKKYSKEYDPTGEGIQIMALLNVDEGKQLPEISMVMSKIPMSDVLRYVCQATGLKYRIDNGVVGIGKNVDEMQTESFPVRRDVISRISEGQIDTTAGGLLPGRTNSRPLPTGANALPFGGNVPTMDALGNAGANGTGATGRTGTGATLGGFTTNTGSTAPGSLLGRAPGIGARSSSGSSSSRRSSSSSSSSGGTRSGVGLGGFSGGSGNTSGGLGGGSNDTIAASFDPASVVFAKRLEPVTSETLIQYFTERGISFSNGATVAYDPRSNKLLVKNTVENLRKMDNLLRQLNIEVPMVLVEARIVEVTENDIDQLGFNWVLSATGDPSSLAGGSPGWTINQLDGMDGNDNPLRLSDQYSLINSLKIFPNFGESLFGSDTDVDLSLSVNAVSENKTSEVLNAPRILTASDTWASLEMTESRYYPSDWEYGDDNSDDSSDSSSSSNWGDSTTIVMEAPTPVFDDGGTELGVNFAVRPIIGPDNYTITLDLYLKIFSYIGKWTYDYSQRVYTIAQDNEGNMKATLLNQLDTEIWMPIYGERELTVKVKIYDGETIVLGGMIDSRTTTYNDKWPVLGEIPLVGRLFQTKYDGAEKTNLLIFVTTRLINNDGVPLHNLQGGRGVPEFRN